MNKIAIVPDIHGRDFWRPVMEFEGHIVFLGDYLDPYGDIPEKQAIQEFMDIVQFKKENPDRVTLLIGNHELHYYDPRYCCSRFSISSYVATHSIFTSSRTRDLFDVCKQIDGYLFSHA